MHELAGHYTTKDFAQLVAREDWVERKTGLGGRPLQEAFVAMSNTDGGVVLVGVTDDCTVVGRQRDQGADDKIHEAAMSARDLGRYSISEIHVGDRSVIAIKVERRVEGFAQTSDGRVLVRRGGRNTALMGSDLARFLNERSLHRFETTETDVDTATVVPAVLEEVRLAYGWDRDNVRSRLVERSLCTPGGKLTVAGVLVLTDPAATLSHDKATVEVRRHPGASISDFDRREEFGGPLHHQITAAAEFILGELGSEVVVTGLHRFELARLPEVVVREVMANAVAHRSYEARGTSIVVDLFPDRVMVSSPGAFPEPVTAENLRHTQAARNPTILDVLRRFRLAEDAGRGIDVIEDEMEAALLDPPTFHDTGASVVVGLPVQGPITGAERAWVHELEHLGELRTGDRLLLVHAARGERLTNTRAREILNVDAQDARSGLQRLRDLGLLRQHGERGGANYTLLEQFAPRARRRTSLELEEIVLREARHGAVSNETVRELTGLTRQAALALLRKLVAEGLLQKSGSKRGTRYHAV